MRFPSGRSRECRERGEGKGALHYDQPKELHHNLGCGDWVEDIKLKINGNNNSHLAHLKNWEEPTTTFILHFINFIQIRVF